MKRTLLEMTQDVLASIKGDEVNSINDTLEAQNVAEIIRREYFEIVADYDMPEHRDLFELIASTDSTKPLLMTLPANVMDVERIEYNKIQANETVDRYGVVYYLSPELFLQRVSNLDTSETYYSSMTHTVGSDTFEIIYRNDSSPSFWTSWDDQTLVFDSIDTAVDSTLVKNKTRCMGLTYPTFTMSDTFYPDLDARHFPLLVQESIATAWAELKVTVNEKAERKSRRGRIRLQKKKQNAPDYISFYSNNTPDYGRK